LLFLFFFFSVMSGSRRVKLGVNNGFMQEIKKKKGLTKGKRLLKLRGKRGETYEKEEVKR